MKEFPIYLNIKNKNNFRDIYMKNIKYEFRKEIHNFLLCRKNEKDYWDIEKYSKKFLIDIDLGKKIIHELCKELEKLGWKYKLSYGDTGLFIYSTEKVPVNCW